MLSKLEDLSTSGKIGLFLGTFMGATLGYGLGTEAVEYARKIAENPDVVTYMVKVHPNITKALTTISFGIIGNRLGVIGSELTDLVLEKLRW